MICGLLWYFNKVFMLEYPETVEVTASGQTGGEDRMEFSNAWLTIFLFFYWPCFQQLPNCNKHTKFGSIYYLIINWTYVSKSFSKADQCKYALCMMCHFAQSIGRVLLYLSRVTHFWGGTMRLNERFSVCRIFCDWRYVFKNRDKNQKIPGTAYHVLSFTYWIIE